jgi:hypothetical protein
MLALEVESARGCKKDGHGPALKSAWLFRADGASPLPCIVRRLRYALIWRVENPKPHGAMERERTMANEVEKEKELREMQWRATLSLASAVSQLAQTIDRLANVVSNIEARIGHDDYDRSIGKAVASDSELLSRPR